MSALLPIASIALCVFGIAYVSHWAGYRKGYNKGWHNAFELDVKVRSKTTYYPASMFEGLTQEDRDFAANYDWKIAEGG